MKEKDFASRFREVFMKKNPDYFYYKIGDSPGGSLKPFDSFAICNGRILCFEFKVGHNKVKKHQRIFLDIAAKNGAHSFIVTPKNSNFVLRIASEIARERRRKEWNLILI